MDKDIIHELQKNISVCINNHEYEQAETYYKEELLNMSDHINSYNPKLEEYSKFLWKYCDHSLFSAKLKSEITRLINNYPVKIDQKYSLYMLAGNIEELHKNVDVAIKWFKKANKIHQAGFIASNLSEKKLRKLKSLL